MSREDNALRSLELKIPPLLLVFIAAALMWLIARELRQFQFPLPARRLLAALASTAGIFAAALGVYSFRRARTTVNPMKPAAATSLVVSGIYTISRNPMYVGFLL